MTDPIPLPGRKILRRITASKKGTMSPPNPYNHLNPFDPPEDEDMAVPFDENNIKLKIARKLVDLTLVEVKTSDMWVFVCTVTDYEGKEKIREVRYGEPDARAFLDKHAP